MHDIKKILVVSTSTATSEHAIHDGVALANKLGAKLYVYHSDYDPFDLEGWGLPIPSLQTIRESYRSTLETDRETLNKIVEQEKTRGMDVQVFVNDKPIAKEIPRIVREEQIDLLVMAAFEEGRLEHFLFSSTAHEIVRTMPCSVLLVKERHKWEE